MKKKKNLTFVVNAEPVVQVQCAGIVQLVNNMFKMQLKTSRGQALDS